jgi:hypothetical protein
MSRLWLLLLVACSERVVVTAQVIHVDAEQTASASVYYDAIGLHEMCGPDVGYIDADTTEVDAISDDEPTKLTGVVEFEYTGSVATSDKPYLAYLISGTNVAQALAVGDANSLYEVDLQQGVVTVDKTRLVAASGNTLQFAYTGWTETHTVDNPRPIAVNVDTDWVGCCSTSHPTTGALWLVAIMQILARRRCRRARRPRR